VLSVLYISLPPKLSDSYPPPQPLPPGEGIEKEVPFPLMGEGEGGGETEYYQTILQLFKTGISQFHCIISNKGNFLPGQIVIRGSCKSPLTPSPLPSPTRLSSSQAARGEGITHPYAPLKRGFIISPPSTGGVGEGAHLRLLQEPH